MPNLSPPTSMWIFMGTSWEHHGIFMGVRFCVTFHCILFLGGGSPYTHLLSCGLRIGCLTIFQVFLSPTLSCFPKMGYK